MVKIISTLLMTVLFIGVASQAYPEKASLQKAQAYYNSREYNLALKEFKEIIQKSSDLKLTSKAQFMLGKSYYALHNYGDALKSFLKFLNTYPGDNKLPEAKYFIAHCFERENLLRQAITWHQKVIQEHPKSRFAKESFKGMKMCENRLGVKPEEETKGETGKDKKLEALFQKGLSYQKSGKYAEAIKVFKGIMYKYPRSEKAPEAFYQIGMIYYVQKKYEKAIKTFREFLRKYSRGKFADVVRYYLGKCYDGQIMLCSNYKDAVIKMKETLKEFRKVIEDYPNSQLADDALERSGCIYTYLGDWNTALKLFRKVLKEYPEGDKAPCVQHYINFYYYNKKNYQRALVEFRKTVEDYPDTLAAQKAEEYIEKLKDMGYK